VVAADVMPAPAAPPQRFGYVVDGRHRVSVARALGHRDIEARVTRAGAGVDIERAVA
jgi:hypothetical protein